MAKAEWGVKRICHNCGARYYDMRRTPPVCPVCGTAYDPEAFLRSRRSRNTVIDEEKPIRGARDAEQADVAGEAEEVEDEGAEPGDLDEDGEVGIEEVASLEDEEEEPVAAEDLDVEEEDDASFEEASGDDADADALIKDADELDDGEIDEVPEVDKREES